MENEMLIKSKANQHGFKASVYANTIQRKVVISDCANCFTEQELLPFKNWLEYYFKNNKELLTIEFVNVFDSLPFVQPKEDNFIVNRHFRENTENPLAKVIQSLSSFNFLIEGKWGMGVYVSGQFPTIKGNIKTGVIELSGEMYNSYSLDFMHPFFCWFEKLLQSDIQQTHVYLKIGYLSTSYMRRLAEIATALSSWSARTGKKSLWTWYCLEDDEDTKEWFNDIFKMSDNLSHLKCEAIELDERQWDKLLK